MGLSCQILIQRPRDGVHKSGRPISGSVRYSVDEDTNYKDIILSLVGKGECTWTENRHINNRSTNITFRGTEIFVQSHIRIINKNQMLNVSAGSYEYHFGFILPDNIPPSFKNSTCKIVYKISIKFEKPNYFSFNKTFSVPINVYGCVRPLPTTNPVFVIQKSLVRPFSKRVHTITVQGQLSNTVYSPGANSNILYNVINNTDVQITAVKTELLCYTIYTADCGRRRETKKIIKECTVETPSVPIDAVANMSSLLPIPPHLYSIQNSRIIVKEYKLKVSVRLPFPYINASTEMPVVIGETRDDRMTEVAYFARDAPGSSMEAVPGFEDGPPAYWEVMNEDKDKDND